MNIRYPLYEGVYRILTHMKGTGEKNKNNIYLKQKYDEHE